MQVGVLDAMDKKDDFEAILRCSSNVTSSTSSLSPCNNSNESTTTRNVKKTAKPIKNTKKGKRKKDGILFTNLPFPLGTLVPDSESNEEDPRELMGIEDRMMMEGDRDYFIQPRSASLVAPSTREERQNEMYARKVGINL